jgi:dihydroorotase
LGVEGQQMTELAELAAAGVVGFADGRPIANLGLLRRALEYLQPLGKPVALVPCDLKLAGNGVMREGVQSLRFGLPGNPAIAESTALAAILEVVAAIGTPVHLMRISTHRSVELLEDAKARGLPVTASTTWMHLLLNTEDLGRYDPNLRLEPPLGNPVDQAALLRGVREGIIDAIAIDHTPYTYEEKTVAFAEAPPGAIGLELALPLLWHTLVETGDWSALELWQRFSIKPAICLQQNPSAIAPNQPAELVLFNPQQKWKIEKHSLKSHSSNTPWLGQQLTGRVVQTWCPPQGLDIGD